MFKVAAFAAGAAALSTPEQHDPARHREVERINNTPGITWQAGIPTRFKGQPLGTMKTLLGVDTENNLKHIQDGVSAGMYDVVKAPADFVMPDSFDSETNWPECKNVIGDIRDQSNCGCCWAFGGASAASDRMCIATKAQTKVPLSSTDLCFCASDDGCDGGQID